MNRMLQIIYTVNNLSTGIMLPVLTLVLLEKGANLQTLPLLMAVYSLTVLLFELPSGIVADMFGRKTVFLMSCVFQLISFTLLLVSVKFLWLVSAIIFLGLGRAFSSGSLDAIIIDRALENGGEDDLPKVTSRLSVLESVGLAAGSIAGGLAASVFGTFSSIIIIRLILTAIVTLLCLIFVRELARQHTADKTAPVLSLTGMFRQGRQLILDHRELGYILIGVFITGFFLFTVETYWQPAFKAIPNISGNTWLFGIVTFIGFFSVTAGNILSRKLLIKLKNSWWIIFGISRVILAAVILIFAVISGAAGFIIFYACMYLMLGTSGVPESSIVNKYTPSDMRASMLSLNSLVSQVGGLFSSLFSSFMVIRLGFSGIWLIAGILMACHSLFLAAVVIMPMAKSLISTLHSKRKT
ncbi:MAG TPA: MFS transporter [Clostridia bacterium]|nr:MFS transporter [Clostridia bacterium]